MLEAAKEQMQLYEEDYNLAKITSEVRELEFQIKGHDAMLKKMQREIEVRVTESLFMEMIALINSGIHTDPNINKLLKTREGREEEEKDKLKYNALLFSRKLNQLSESLSVLLAQVKRVDGKATAM